MSSCAHNVAQDAATGEDGKEKGAKPITLDNGEGKAVGIVTYPGGDRIDWKMIDLPDKARGTLDFELSWTPPRPGLQLAFDVFNEWNEPLVASGGKAGKKHGKGHVQTASLDNAKGKYFVRIYAVGRGDAGKYKLTVHFNEQAANAALNPASFSDPPKLADVPPPDVPCDEFQFDPKNPACRTVCPASGAPPGWPACKDKCPTPPDVNVPACLATMDCPQAPDRRIRKCTKDKFPACPDAAKPDPANPNCDGIKVAPTVGRVIGKSIQNGEVVITINVGTDQRVQSTWTGAVLRGQSDSPLAGGEVTIVRVDKNLTVGKVRLTVDELLQNPRVRLSAP